MKSKIAVTVLSVLLALSLVASCLFFLHVQKRNEKYIRDTEEGWEDYLWWCDLEESDPFESYLDFEEDGSSEQTHLRCYHNESFDYMPDGTCVISGTYIYDLFLFSDGTGTLYYRHYITVSEEIEHETAVEIVSHNELYEESQIPLTAEEVNSVVDVMVEWDYAHLYTYVPEEYIILDGDTTFLYCPVWYHADERFEGFRGHLVKGRCAEEGSGVYEIRKAIEALIVAHDGGSVPGQYYPED